MRRSFAHSVYFFPQTYAHISMYINGEISAPPHFSHHLCEYLIYFWIYVCCLAFRVYVYKNVVISFLSSVCVAVTRAPVAISMQLFSKPSTHNANVNVDGVHRHLQDEKLHVHKQFMFTHNVHFVFAIGNPALNIQLDKMSE